MNIRMWQDLVDRAIGNSEDEFFGAPCFSLPAVKLHDRRKSWYEVQDLLIDELIENQLQGRDIPKADKGAHYQVKYTEVLLRTLANCIAWMILFDEKHIVRRLMDNTRPVPILSANLSATQAYVSSVRADMGSFSLITDLTSCVKYGDILTYLSHPHPRFNLIELKEGTVNREILHGTGTPSHLSSSSQESDRKAAEHSKQADRIRRQKLRALQAVDVVNNDGGTDPVTGARVMILPDKHIIKDFSQRLSEQIDHAKQKGWAIDCIDGCLYVGCYIDMRFGRSAFYAWMLAEGVDPEVVDVRRAFSVGDCRPLQMNRNLAHRAGEIAFGEVQVLLCLDQTRLVEMMEKSGLAARKLSGRESMNYVKSLSKAYRPHQFKHSIVGLKLDSTAQEYTIGDGFYNRIYFDLVYPSECIRLEMSIAEHLA